MTKAEKIAGIKEDNRRECVACKSKNAQLILCTIVCYDCGYKNQLLADLYKQSYPRY